MEKPYTKSVDIWTIGIISYLLLCGFLPFDDENSEREIARQTIHDKIPFPEKSWKKLSKESKSFIQSIFSKIGLLVKEPEKRLQIKDILEHSWFNIHIKTKKET